MNKQPKVTKPIKKKVVAAPAFQSAYHDFDRQELALLRQAQEAQDYVWLELKLVDFSFADFTICVRSNTPLWTIRRHVQERHAHTPKLQFFRAPVHKKNEILDFSLTLENLGIIGGPKEAKMTGVIYYAFKPIRGDPIVLREPDITFSKRYGGTDNRYDDMGWSGSQNTSNHAENNHLSSGGDTSSHAYL